MISVREAIVVEGRYDKARLASVVDALVVETRGFGIFKDKELLRMLRTLARERGLLVLTDSDSAGFVIRDYLSGAIPPEQIKHAYIPNLHGKERRKSVPSKEGYLGVEGVEGEIIVDAIRRAGATVIEQPDATFNGAGLTKLDLYECGLTGGKNSADRRRKMLGLLGLPQSLSVNRMLDVLNATMTKSQFVQTARDFGWI